MYMIYCGVCVLDSMVLAYILILLGAIMVLVEIATPGFFIAVPGTIAILYGIAILLFPWLLETWWGPWALLALAFPLGALTYYIYRRLSPPSPPVTESFEGLIGKLGVVVETVEPDSIRGKVRIDSDVWSATSTKRIETGTRVIVVGVEGVHLIVEPLEEKDIGSKGS